MPIGEKETHPFLNAQVDIKANHHLDRYKYLVVGTFPIYCLTLSNPIESEGCEKKNEWAAQANMQFFYGSRGSHFWELFANAFGEPIPTDQGKALGILDKHDFLITDAVLGTERIQYGPSDSKISAKKTLNDVQLQAFIKKMYNLRAIFFTSKKAKEWFCIATMVPYKNLIIERMMFEERQTCLFVLPTPAGYGRSIGHYFQAFPLNEIEKNSKKNKIPYAHEYRKRIYTEALNMRISCSQNL